MTTIPTAAAATNDGGTDWVAISGAILIPLVVLFLGLAWPAIVRWWRNREFEGLVLRELAEAGPLAERGEYDKGSPDDEGPGPPVLENALAGDKWPSQMRSDFLHRRLITDPVGASEIVLSINPTFAYHLSQLWDAYERGETVDGVEWLYHLGELRVWLAGREKGDDPMRQLRVWLAGGHHSISEKTAESRTLAGREKGDDPMRQLRVWLAGGHHSISEKTAESRTRPRRSLGAVWRRSRAARPERKRLFDKLDAARARWADLLDVLDGDEKRTCYRDEHAADVRNLRRSRRAATRGEITPS